MSGISTPDFEKYAKNRSGGKTNLRFFHLNAGIVKSIQHRGVLANKGNLENVDQLSIIQCQLAENFQRKGYKPRLVSTVLQGQEGLWQMQRLTSAKNKSNDDIDIQSSDTKASKC